MKHLHWALKLILVLAVAVSANAQGTKSKSGFITTSDGVKIHYIEASVPGLRLRELGPYPLPQTGPGGTPPTFPRNPPQINPGRASSILFVPGWTMPAWIWEKQIEHFSKSTRVVAMDPRAQGESTKTGDGLYPAARAHDIKAVVDQLHLAPVVLVGWSMGVTEVAAYVDQFGTQGLAGIVLVDGIAGGMDAQFAKAIMDLGAKLQADRRKQTEAFVRSMYRKPQTEDYIQRVTNASLATPTNSAVALFVGAFGADYRATLPKIDVPTLVLAAGDDASNPFMVKSKEMQQAIPGARLEQFPGCGHALFVDDAGRFNSLLDEFLKGLPTHALKQ
jgi:non-heme chloroperoxidase